MNNKAKNIIHIFIVIVAFLILHNTASILIGNILSLMRENNLPSLEISSYKKKIETLESSLMEYENTLNNLKIFENDSYILGKISIRNIYKFYDILEVATDNPVKKNSLVVNEKGVVGIVKDVTSKTATVKLLTGAPNLSVKIGEYNGILNGYDKKNKLLIVHNINNYANIEENMEVLTSPMQSYPEDILVGSVFKTETIGVEKVIYVKPAVDFDNLNYLMIIDR